MLHAAIHRKRLSDGVTRKDHVALGKLESLIKQLTTNALIERSAEREEPVRNLNSQFLVHFRKAHPVLHFVFYHSA